MPRAGQWTVQRPRWAALLSWGLYGGALISLGYFLSSVYPALAVAGLIALLALWTLIRYKQQGESRFTGVLSVDHTGRWVFAQAGPHRSLMLNHAWPGFAWVTLRFSDSRATRPKETMLELTIWKSSVSPEAWRQLQVCIAGQMKSSLQRARGS